MGLVDSFVFDSIFINAMGDYGIPSFLQLSDRVISLTSICAFLQRAFTIRT